MKKVYCLLNHQLTERQITQLHESFAACDVIYPPEDLSRLWAQIPATEKIDTSVIASVADWLSSASKGDLLIVQGEIGSTFMLVDYALKRGLIPLHAVTKRVAQENRCGEQVQKQHIFEHVCFRQYAHYPEF